MLRSPPARRATTRGARVALPAPEALLFDMDGVLVDVRQSYDEAIYRTVLSFLPGRGRPSRAAVLAVKQRIDANDDFDAVRLVLAGLGRRPRRDEIERRFQACYLGSRDAPGLHRRERWLVPSAVLRRLAGRLPLGIVTGRTAMEADMALRAAGVRRWFDAVVTTDDVAERKPHPAPVRRALRLLGAKRAWLLGDSPADLVAARRAGIVGIGVTGCDPRGRGAVLHQYGPAVLLRRASQIVQYLPA